MITEENFLKLISTIKESQKELSKYEGLGLLLGEHRLIETHWEIQDLLIFGMLSELQADYFNHWIFECYFGEEKRKFIFAEKQRYVGKDAKKVYKTLIEL
jgi:hypothetical protein